MKTRMFVSVLILVLAVLIIAWSCATETRIILPVVEVAEVEELHGTWSNKDHDGTAEPAKWDFNPDGTCDFYRTTTDNEPYYSIEYTINDKWTDDMGNVWYKFTWEDDWGSDGYGLSIVSDSGTILEVAQSVTDYPTEIDRNTTFRKYSGILHRQ